MTFSPIRASVNIVLFFALVGALLPLYVLCLSLVPMHRHHIARLFFRGCVALTGLRLRQSGTPKADVAFFAANHSSYLDIPVLGAVASKSVFVAKSEVASWPLFGILARLSKTLFISRRSTDISQQCALMSSRINQGNSLIVFPEGTSTDGSYVKAFKSSLYACLDDVERDTWVQPVSIVYARTKSGKALEQSERERFTWFDDMTLAPHLLHVFGIEGCEVDVVFHEPLHKGDFANRKDLAHACWKRVAHSVNAAITSHIHHEQTTEAVQRAAP